MYTMGYQRYFVMLFVWSCQQNVNLIYLIHLRIIFGCDLLAQKLYTQNEVIMGNYSKLSYSRVRSHKTVHLVKDFEIWHGDRYGYEVSKKIHRKQVGVSSWWSDCEQSNMAATGTWKSHMSAKFMIRIKCDTTFSMFLDMRNPFLL